MNTFLPAHAGANHRGGKRWRWGEGGVLERASVYVFDGAQVGKGEERKMDD